MLAAAVAERSAGSGRGKDALMRSSPGYPRSGRHMCMDEAPRPMLWWTMRAWPGRLEVRAEAADEERLRQIQDLITARLQKFGRRENLTVNWQQPQPDTTERGS